jgi:hypothetical protein
MFQWEFINTVQVTFYKNIFGHCHERSRAHLLLQQGTIEWAEPEYIYSWLLA